MAAAAAAASDSEEEVSSDEDPALESAMTHNNPFAALKGEADRQAAELANSDSSSADSASTSAGVEPHGSDSDSSASHLSHKPHGHRHEHAEPDLAEQRQAILARFRRSGAGPLQEDVATIKSSRAASEARHSRGHAAGGQLCGSQPGPAELGSAKQLRAKLGGTLVASELVQRLCCPITEARPCPITCGL